MRLIFYEDNSFANFYPATLSRPVFMLLLGTSMIFEKWLDILDVSEFSFFTRDYLAEISAFDTGADVGIIPDDEILLINGRFLPTDEAAGMVRNLKSGEALLSGDYPIAYRLARHKSAKLNDAVEILKNDQLDEKLLSHCKPKKADSFPLNYLWDLIAVNGETIDREFERFGASSGIESHLSAKTELINPKLIHISKDSEIAPLVVLDASRGAVVVDSGVVIEPFTYVQGPAYIGPGSRLVGGRIRGGCSFGPVCRVGGEVEESIMHGRCNKYHEGFLGHAYLGEWVNLGALTTNSDLKNNYADIKAQPFEKPINTGSMKVGCFIGDHTKTGIGTMLNTGISVGFSCNLYGASLFTERRIKSFSWGTPGRLVDYELAKAVETAAASMSRREKEFTEIHQRLFARIAEID